MNRNTALIWTLVSTLLCGWPGICILSIGIPSLIMQPQPQSDISGTVLYISVSLIFVAVSIIIAFRSFRSSIDSGIAGLGLMMALCGLLQLGTAFLFVLAAGAATNTTGMVEIIVSFLISGLCLVCISIFIWLVRVRKPVEKAANAPLAPVVYKSVAAENDPGYTKSTKIMLVVLAIVIIAMIINIVMRNL